MAAYIKTQYVSGVTMYAIIRNASNQVWNGSTFESFNASNYASYDVALAEQGNTGYYVVEFPSGIPASTSKYSFSLHVTESSPAHGDAGITNGEIGWDGTNEIFGLSFTTTQLAAINAEVVDALATDTIAELSSIPSSTPTMQEALMLLYMWLRNSTTSTATSRAVKNNAGTSIGTATMSDDGTTFTQGKLS